MNARRAARELALLAFSQLVKNSKKSPEIEEIIISSIRTLVDDAENNLKLTVSALADIKEYIENYEIEHPENVKRSIEASIIPVPMPMTSDMLGRIDSIIDVADKAYSALEISELASLSNKAEVKTYTINLSNLYTKNKKEIDEQISKHSKGWNIERLVRIDKNILRIAITELLYVEDVPISVSIDEAVELAKKYSTDESASFINGILRQVVEENQIIQYKK
ncbi:MAG: transcription antitermination factor NusB [Candidatus Gastranaerophilales bacterium]|nr:transcription antitermination factor NusB [Candidatus Gastranaerophilales bacterium]